MRLTIFFIAVFFAWQSVLAQTFPARPLVSPITFDKYFKDTLTFTKKWDYPWYIVADDNGANMENTSGGPLTKTIRSIYIIQQIVGQIIKPGTT